MSIQGPGVPDDSFLEEPTSPSSPAARRGRPEQWVPFAENWDKYELLDFLGRGGMGLVYRARDRHLGRTVAIKFVLEANPTMAARFLCEARAQSRIDHPNICHVYEVGEVEGRAYIALQFVKGEPLQRAAKRLSLEEKILVMRDVAVAIHEAHRLGVVHRDLKPGNVLVTRTPEGRWFPVVMDFGLARELSVNPTPAEPDVGFVQGTPAYMSPEQARGELNVVDRRSDVYSLGATLYELVTGQVPFTGDSSAQTLSRVLREEPLPPRSLVPNLPSDLEAIILQCLAKDPAQRYPSARALADDLGRYLDGEPVLGHRRALGRQLRSLAKRYPVLTTLAASACVILALVTVFGLRSRALMNAERERARKHACLIRQVSEEVGKIRGSLREAYLNPLHDVRRDQQRAKEGLKVIGALLQDPDSWDAPFVHEGLGRGYLALGAWERAITEFRAAQAGGLNTPEGHADLGRALGEMYFRSLGGISRPIEVGDAPAPELLARRAELVKRYLDPARLELALAGDASPLGRIRQALYARDFAVAEQLAREVADEDPASLEAYEIAGEAAMLAATEAFDHGDYDKALPALERAASAFAKGSLVARSDGRLYRAAADTWLLVAEVEYRRQRLPSATLQRALDLLDQGALVADPDDVAAHVTKAYVLLHWYRTSAGTPFTDEATLLDQVVASAARAVALDRKDPRALIVLGSAYIYRGSYEFFHGKEGPPWWRLAASRLEEALALTPDDPRARNMLGVAHRWLGDALGRMGRDPSREYEMAGKSFAHALLLDSGYIRACVNQTELSTLMAEYTAMSGQDPLSFVEKARQIGSRCLAGDATSYSVLDVLARAELARADYLLAAKGDPTQALQAARDFLDQSAASLPDHAELWFQRGTAARIEGAFRVQRGSDPTEVTTQGRAALKSALVKLPSNSWVFIELARLGLVDASFARANKGSWVFLLNEARQYIENAVALDGRLAWGHLVAAEVYLQLAAGNGSLTDTARGIVHADEASRLYPGIPGGRAVRDALERLRRK